MTYEPRTYWTERALRQGAGYVAYGGREDRANILAKIFTKVIRDMLGREKIGWLLDFGCGSGRLAPVIAPFGARYFGMDISPVGVVLAGVAHPDLDFTWLKDDRIPLDDGKVSLVAAVTVFQHIVSDEDWALWTGELRRVLKPDGKVLVIDAPFLEIELAEHMCLRTPEAIGEALGRPTLKEYPTAEKHFVGMFQP